MVPSWWYIDSLGLTTLWIQQAQSTPTVLREKMKVSSQSGISNAVKMMNSLKDNSKILSYLSRNIDNTYTYILHDKLVPDMANLVQWCRDKVTQTISIEIWRSYLPADILSIKTEHIPQKPWSFLFSPCNYKAYWMQPGFGDWPYCFSKRRHRVLFSLNSTPLHGACQTDARISLSSFSNK